jgi:hypothetical protein
MSRHKVPIRNGRFPAHAHSGHAGSRRHPRTLRTSCMLFFRFVPSGGRDVSDPLVPLALPNLISQSVSQISLRVPKEELQACNHDHDGYLPY